MNLSSYFIPTAEEFKLLSNHPTLSPVVEKLQKIKKPLSPHYYSFGCRVNTARQFSISSLATTVLSHFSNDYLIDIGKAFVRYSHKKFLNDCAHKIDQVRASRFTPISKHPNVFYLTVTPTRSVLLKTSKLPSDAKARGKMEELIWNCAQILELDDYFTPTFFDEKRGCLQVEVIGTDLIEMLNENYLEPKREQLITAFLVSIFLGFYDAHNANISIDQSGQIRFIDNVRALAHTNDYIRTEDNDFLSPFRSGLLSLYGAYSQLHEADWTLIKQLITHFESKLPALEQQIRAIDGDALPENWYNANQIIQSMHARLNLIAEATTRQSYTSLRDLALTVYPSFKFLSLLSLAAPSIETKMIIDALVLHRSMDMTTFQTFLLADVCSDCVSVDSKLRAKLSVDLQELWDRCHDLNMPFEHLIDWVITSDQKIKAPNKIINRIEKEILDRSCPDWKD